MDATDPSEQTRALAALTLLPGLGPVRIGRLLETCGSADEALRAPRDRLVRIDGIGPGTVTKIVEARAEIGARVDDEIARLGAIGARFVGIHEDAYPPLLREIPAAPPVLRVRGSLDALGGGACVAVVGSRRCTIYGTEQARRFAGSLGSAGLVIVSGGARGIDAAAHGAALDSGATTVVVQGCGLGHTYPSEHGALYDRVVGSGGAVVSELPFDTPPSAENFPARNRIISGLALGVLVIEAGRRSGALITARHAVEDHGRDAFGVPGRVDSSASAGTNELLKSGAHLVTEPGEVLEILDRSTHRSVAERHGSESSHDGPGAAAALGDLDPIARRMVEALTRPMTGDELGDALGVDPATIRVHATMLEVQGRIRRRGSAFERAI